MNSDVYSELRKIYENSLIGEPDFPRAAHGQRGLTQSDVSYKKYGLPGAVPGQGQPTAIGIPVESEEDYAVSGQKILNKIRSIKQEAIEEGMDYAVFVLSSLESFILSLKRNP